MPTTIAFFDVTPKEKVSFEHYFTGSKFKVLFFNEPIGKIAAYDYKSADIISVYTTSHIDSTILSHAPKLKLIACRSTGFDNIDIEACQKRKVAVCNVPGYGQTTVAEYTIMLMLMTVRKMPAVLKAVSEGHIDYNHLTGTTLHGKTLGVIGTGKIGLSVIKIAKSMGMHIVAYDPYPNEQAAKTIGFSYIKLQDLFKGADIITLHAPLTPDTRHIVDAKALKLMSEHSILINTARGELVETQALIEALRTHQIAAAALDVIEGERTIDGEIEHDLFRANREILFEIAEIDILSKMNNVILSPHNAFNSKEALYFIRKTTVENINAFLAGKPQNIVELKK